MRINGPSIGMTWIIPGEVAAFGVWALKEPDVLEAAGVRAIVSLTETPADELVGEKRFDLLHLPVVDMSAPTNKQIEEFVGFVERKVAEGKSVGVHCMAGLGRTGTMIACLLVSRGLEADEAIGRVRLARPGSVQTESQEQAVRGWGLVVSAKRESGASE